MTDILFMLLRKDQNKQFLDIKICIINPEKITYTSWLVSFFYIFNACLFI